MFLVQKIHDAKANFFNKVQVHDVTIECDKSMFGRKKEGNTLEIFKPPKIVCGRVVVEVHFCCSSLL